MLLFAVYYEAKLALFLVQYGLDCDTQAVLRKTTYKARKKHEQACLTGGQYYWTGIAFARPSPLERLPPNLCVLLSFSISTHKSRTRRSSSPRLKISPSHSPRSNLLSTRITNRSRLHPARSLAHSSQLNNGISTLFDARLNPFIWFCEIQCLAGPHPPPPDLDLPRQPARPAPAPLTTTGLDTTCLSPQPANPQPV